MLPRRGWKFRPRAKQRPRGVAAGKPVDRIRIILAPSAAADAGGQLGGVDHGLRELRVLELEREIAAGTVGNRIRIGTRSGLERNIRKSPGGRRGLGGVCGRLAADAMLEAGPLGLVEAVRRQAAVHGGFPLV